MARVGQRTEQVLRNVDPKMAKAVKAALVAAPEWLDFAVICGLRTEEEQAELFKKGRSDSGVIHRLNEVVTYRDGVEKRSAHQDRGGSGYGEAIDIVAYIGGRPDFDPDACSKVAAYIVGFCAAHDVQLIGGVKWGWDEGHLELAK